MLGALKVEKGSAIKPCLLPLDGTPLPVASVSGYRYLHLGPGIRMSCGLTTCLLLETQRKKDLFYEKLILFPLT